MRQKQGKPVLLIDIDGVISLWGWGPNKRPHGAFRTIDGHPHFLSGSAGEHLLRLADRYENVWCSGWEERANDHLPHLLGLPGPLPYLSFVQNPGSGHAHWKLDAIDAYAGERPVAWVDDALDQACQDWAAARQAPTLLVHTDPASGLTEDHVRLLEAWAPS